MAKYGKKVPDGTTSGRKAAKATKAGHLGDDNKVYVNRKVVADYSNRTRKQPNEHGA
jgi:hypothetical protein